MALILPFLPESVDATIVINGVTYRPPIIDSDGHLQVDVLTSALPSGAATSARQDTMITALQLIDDLRAALDAVQTDRLNVNVYRDGASEVKSTVLNTVNPSTTRVTAITPTSGKKVRIIALMLTSASASVSDFEAYFGTGANIVIAPAKAIGGAVLDVVDFPTFGLAWPDGGGPVGDVDEVVSLHTSVNVSASGRVVITYREE